MNSPLRGLRSLRDLRVYVVAVILLLATGHSAYAQRGGGARGGGGPAASPRDAAALDLTGYWVSVISEDWKYRMVTPRSGVFDSLPLNAEGRKVGLSWDAAQDEAAGEACRAYTAANVMRLPGRLHITWRDANTLQIDTDAGTQTRLLHFDRAAQPGSDKTWQGFSVADWQGPGVGRGAPPVGDARVTGGGVLAPSVPGGGGRGLRGGPPPRQQAQINFGGDLKVVTTNFREGYLRKNGVPYSEQATITEYIHRLPTHPNGDNWLHVTTIVEDPRYLSQPFYTSTHFRLEPNDASFAPTPCATPPPLPVKPVR